MYVYYGTSFDIVPMSQMCCLKNYGTNRIFGNNPKVFEEIAVESKASGEGAQNGDLGIGKLKADRHNCPLPRRTQEKWQE
jgi:hypothetical protein